MNTLFIPIKSQNLAHYYSTGLILPAIFFENRAEDIQSYYENKIVLSEKRNIEGIDCYLEIVLNELKPIQLSQNLKILDKPIPISRVKSIYFLSQQQKKITLWNINNSTAFIPEKLVKVEQAPIEKIKVQQEVKNDKTKNTKNYSVDIQKFNSILGGLAFMKISAIPPMNYSPNYFVVLSDLNKIIERELTKTNLNFNYKLKGILTGSASGWKILLQYLKKKITKDYVLNLAKEKNIKLEQNYILEFDKLDLKNSDAKIIYYLSIIATYGKGKQKKVEDLYFDLQHGKIKYNKEIVALLFGMYEGYKDLIYKIKDKPVKFELNSKLDFYTIESVYQYVFNGITNNTSFKYIDNWCPKFENKINEEDFITYQILDKKIIVRKKIKPDSPEFVEQFYKKYIPQFLTEINNQEISKFLKLQELFEIIDLKKILFKFQDTIFSSIKSQTTEKQLSQQYQAKKEIEKTSKKYTENYLRKLTLKQLENILVKNNIHYRPQKRKSSYIELILDIQNICQLK